MLSTRSSPLWLNMASDAAGEPDMAGSGSAGDTGDMLLSQGEVQVYGNEKSWTSLIEVKLYHCLSHA